MSTSATQPLKFSEKLGYGLGDAASNFFFQVFNIFLLFYYTDVFGLAPAAVGVMLILTRIVDTISDPAMGLIADRTNTRWGKFRPYILFGAIPYGVFGYLMFAGPDLSDSGKLIYAYITYTLMMLAYTVVNVPYSALLGVISPSSMERTKVASYRFFCAFAAGWVVGTFVGPLKQYLGGVDEALGYQRTMTLFALISVALFWITFATTKERVQPPKVKSDVKKDLRALVDNGPWLMLFIAAIFTLMNVAVRNGSILYYFKYYVGDEEVLFQLFSFLDFNKSSVFISLGMIGFLVGIALTKTLCDHFEKRSLMIVLTILNAITMVAFYFIPQDMFWTMVLFHFLGSLFIGPTPPLVWSMYADCADYGEWKSGRRTTALVFSTVQFAQKLGLAVGAGLLGIILSAIGFVANEVQNEETMTGIRFIFSFLPAIFAVIGAISIFFYTIDRKMIEQIEHDMIERHKELQSD